jgi:tetratricopeptide (TPR) repeat protein
MPKHTIIPRAIFLVALAAVAALVFAGANARAGDEIAAELSQKLKTMPIDERLGYLRGLETGGRRDVGVYFQFGNTFFNLGELDSAVVYYQRTIEVDSTYSKAWVNLGLVLDSQRKNAEARRAFREALKINDEDVLAYCHLGFSHFTAGNVDEALEMYDKALSIDPDCAQAHYNLGLAFADAKIFREALLEWEKVIELDGDGELGRTAAENVELIRTYMELGDS